jgi:SAM-dependent methyltransferase
MKILNLGCGSKVSSDNEIINIDWSIYLLIKKNSFLNFLASFLVDDKRLSKISTLPNNIMVHNLAKGIPFDSNSVDVVYHSHVLEHLDRDVAKSFLAEVYRVLKPKGTQRIVVPDFEVICRNYISHIDMCDINSQEIHQHDSYISEVLEQSVRREAYSTSKKEPLRRIIENNILGDARKRGETHQWMYDRINLKQLLIEVGFTNTSNEKFNTSTIPDWSNYALDLDKDGNQYKPNSLYIEATK